MLPQSKTGVRDFNSQIEARTTPLTQNMPRRILLGVNLVSADFTPPFRNFVPYLTEGVTNVPYINEGVKKKLNSLPKVYSSWLNRPKCKTFFVTCKDIVDENKTNISKTTYFMHVSDENKIEQATINRLLSAVSNHSELCIIILFTLRQKSTQTHTRKTQFRFKHEFVQ